MIQLALDESIKSSGRSWGQHPNFQSLNRNNSTADCSIALKFGTVSRHILYIQTFKVKGSEITVTAQYKVPANENITARRLENSDLK